MKILKILKLNFDFKLKTETEPRNRGCWPVKGRRISGKAEPNRYIYSIIIRIIIQSDGFSIVVPIRIRTDSEPVA